MKKLTLMFVAAFFLMTISIQAAENALNPAEAPAPPAACDDVRLPEASTEMPAADTTVPALGNEMPIFFAGPKPAPNQCNAIGDCNRWDSQYCDYRCGGYECCTATILIPNSYCPTICA